MTMFLPNTSKDEERKHKRSDSNSREIFPSSQFIDHLPDRFVSPRHEFLTTWKSEESEVVHWRMKERMRTGYVALVVCLNIGVDPPDIVKTEPCARLECWFDPLSLKPAKALDTVGNALQAQYERWQARARYKQSLDPTIDDIKRLCVTFRRAAKNERVLYHYNGHGVPKPTANGEIWVFNPEYTQYIPLSLYDLSCWLGSPSIYVLDCSAAGAVLEPFIHFQKHREAEMRSHEWNFSSADQKRQKQLRECILLGACKADEVLPQNPSYPADVFTACLTTPLKVALRWFAQRSQLTNATPELIDKIPGRPNDRKTIMGELNWIFTAITDTIAWNVLPPGLFQKLFRQDLLVASLFRNFLLADRVLRSLGCTPISYPQLPSTHQHSMWEAWDLAADHCLAQLDRCVADPTQFMSSAFFTEQLTAFEVWLQFGCEKRKPVQLPVVLQVLLSQVHRLRALKLLARFLDKGSWAVNLALSVGIFPYVLKLLQSHTSELREVLVFIWSKILYVDRSCQSDLVKEGFHQYFVAHLATTDITHQQRIMAAFVISAVADDFKRGQVALLKYDVLTKLKPGFSSSNPLVRRWMALAVAKLLENCIEVKLAVIRDNLHEDLYPLLMDDCPEVRAAGLFTFGKFLEIKPTNEAMTSIDLEAGRRIGRMISDGCGMARRELITAISVVVYNDKESFMTLAARKKAERKKQKSISLQSLKPRSEAEKNLSPQYTPSLPPADLLDVLNSPELNVNKTGRKKQSPAKYAQDEVKHSSPKSLPTPDDDLPDILNSPDSDKSTASEPPPDRNHDAPSLEKVNSDLPPLEKPSRDNENRVFIWKVVTTLCRDPMPCVADIALAVRRYISFGSTSALIHSKSHPNFSRKYSEPTKTNPRSKDDRLMAPNRRKHIPFGSTQKVMEHNRQMNNGIYRSSRSSVGSQQQAYARKHSQRSKPRKSTRDSSPSSLQNGASNERKEKRMDPLWRVPVSDYYLWSCQYFDEPLMSSERHASEREGKEDGKYGDFDIRSRWDVTDDLNDADIRQDSEIPTNLKRWYRHRQLDIKADELKERYVPHKIDDQVAVFQTDSEATSKVLFHPYENLIIAADNKNRISVFNFEKRGADSNTFSNQNHHGSKITDLKIVNEDSNFQLLCASDDGCVRLWKNPHLKGEEALVSAFVAVPHMTSRKPGVVVDWQQRSGLMLLSGSTNEIRVWDAEVSQVTLKVPVETTKGVTTMCSGRENGNIVFAGCGDGTVRIFDIRQKNKLISRTSPHHDGFVVQVVVKDNQLISAGIRGNLCFTDLRYQPFAVQPRPTVNIHKNSPLNALAVHEYAPLIASASVKQFVRIVDLNGEEVHTIRYHDGFLGQRIGPISSLAFHRHRLLLAVAGLDSYVSIYAGNPIPFQGFDVDTLF